MNLATLLYFTWDPSKGIEIGTLPLHYYSLMFVLAFRNWLLFICKNVQNRPRKRKKFRHHFHLDFNRNDSRREIRSRYFLSTRII